MEELYNERLRRKNLNMIDEDQEVLLETPTLKIPETTRRLDRAPRRDRHPPRDHHLEMLPEVPQHGTLRT